MSTEKIEKNATGNEVRFLLEDLVSDAREERGKSSLIKEKLDSLEIEQVFKRKKKKKTRAKKVSSPVEEGPPEKKSFRELCRLMYPPIPLENAHLLEEASRSGNLSSLESAITKDLISQKQAGELWGSYLGFAYVNPMDSVVTPEALSLIPEEIARKAEIIPLYIINDVLTFSTSTPERSDSNQRIRNIAGIEVSAVFSLPSEIRNALDIYYSSKEDIQAYIAEFEKQHGLILEGISDRDMQDVAKNQSIAKIVEAILHLAIRERASDIHIEPAEGFCRVRFRIDGKLREMMNISKGIYPAVTSRLRVLTNVNLTESRFPQDGRFALPMGAQKGEFRVSFIPVKHGTKTVIRILGSTGKTKLVGLDEMLIAQDVLKSWRKVIKNPNGIVFVTGPTGSGKTTTLYATLQELNTPEVNIATIEDPIEIELLGLNQSQVNPYIDLNFSIMLRSLLRQDPDIMLVGEIRDKETAKIACEAALTGHLVLATLHTNTAIQAMVRLTEIGLPPYLVAPSINAVLGQRLAARLNDDYKESYKPPDEVLENFFSDVKEVGEILFYRPGPKLPNPYMGFKGRVAIHELVLVSDQMRSLISNNAGMADMTKEARALGYKPLRYDGLKKALMGLTTLDEVERVTPVEWRA